MPHASDVVRRDRDTLPELFKRSIIAARGRGKITPVRCVLESIQRSGAFHVLKECQRKRGPVRESTRS